MMASQKLYLIFLKSLLGLGGILMSCFYPTPKCSVEIYECEYSCN